MEVLLIFFLVLVTAPIITRILEPKELGLASMFLLSLNVLTLLTIFGSNQAFMRYYYDLFGAKKRSFLYKIGYIIIPNLYFHLCNFNYI